MQPTLPTGDIALTARPASSDTFAPFGRLLTLGDRAWLGERGSVLATIDPVRPGPRRFDAAQRYPDARRLLLPLGDVPLLVVVLGPGDPPAGPPIAFRMSPGQGLLIDRGVWHAGPVALEEGAVCELLETPGAVDRLDRRGMSALVGVEAIRVQLPEEPGAKGPELELEAPGTLLVERGIVGRLCLGLLLLDDLDAAPEAPTVDSELEGVAAALRSLGGGGGSVGGRFGVDDVRRLWRELGLDPDTHPPAYERLVRDALGSVPLGGTDALTAAARLVSLRRQRFVAIYDAASIARPLQLRHGREHETLNDERGRTVSVAGTPVLCDRDGPFGGPLGLARRVLVGAGVNRALLALYLPAEADQGDVLAHLEDASRVVQEHCGGREVGRLVV